MHQFPEIGHLPDDIDMLAATLRRIRSGDEIASAWLRLILADLSLRSELGLRPEFAQGDGIGHSRPSSPKLFAQHPERNPSA